MGDLGIPNYSSVIKLANSLINIYLLFCDILLLQLLCQKKKKSKSLRLMGGMTKFRA